MVRVSVAPYGTHPTGGAVSEHTLSAANGVVVKLIDYGAIVTSVVVPDKQGRLADVVLGFDNLEGYIGGTRFFGAVCGRVANRIKNGRFVLDGQTVQLTVNRPPHHLHGGNAGFDRKVWRSERVGDDGVRFTCSSADGEEGYPGAVSASVTYRLSNSGALSIEYEATADRATPINLTNHSYFNLAGKGHVLDHVVSIAADAYTPVDDTIVPTGEIRAVKGSHFDLNTPRRVGDGIGHVGGKGYDHNYVLRKDASAPADRPQPFATVRDPSSGRTLKASCTQPGVQFYTGNFLDATITMRGGVACEPQAGLCLETQHFPDSVNNANFPSTIVRPGERYHHVTVFEFGWE